MTVGKNHGHGHGGAGGRTRARGHPWHIHVADTVTMPGNLNVANKVIKQVV